MSKANLACTTYYEENGKVKYPPNTEVKIKGIDKKSLKERIKKEPAKVLTIPAENGRKLVQEKIVEEK